MRIVRHFFKIFLIGKTHLGIVAAGRNHFVTGFYDGIGGAVIRTPARKVGIVTESHNAGRVGIAIHGQFLHRYLCLGGLAASAVRHQHGGTSDGGVEHFDHPFL